MLKVTELPNGGVLHEVSNGNKFYYFDGLRHREDGPALDRVRGVKEWYINGKRHRKDGPAIDYGNGEGEWYLNDERLDCNSQEEFERLMRLKGFW
jgi:hypothetical protein